ncbi:MAG TPA: type II secretion system F family protein, partial [Mycobacteriales bacterium]|nr:type II secretion system F family protein [Mycobacteriales bacterium]
MGALLGLLLGAGLLLLRPPARSQPAAARRWVRRTRRDPRLSGSQAAAGVVGGALGLAVTGSVGLGTGAAVAAAAVPAAVVRRAARRRAAERRAQWPDAVDHLASAVRAGLSLPEALAALATRGPEPLRPAFAAFAADVRAAGRLAGPLDRLRDRLADPVADRVVETVRMA